MSVRDYKKFNKLSRIANSSFGDSGPGKSRYASMHAKFEIIDEDNIKVMYHTVGNFSTRRLHREQLKKERLDAFSFIEAAMKTFAERYEKEFDEKITLKLNERTVDDGLELFSYSTNMAVQRGIYRVWGMIEIS